MTVNDLLTGLPVIVSLVIIEGLLSVDNVLGIAALAKELPVRQQRQAIGLGVAGAYGFRVLALLLAAWLIANTWVRWLGAGYLVWLMCSHLTRHVSRPAPGQAKPAAVGLAPRDPLTELPVMWPIYTGVLIAILALRAIAPHALKLLKKFPVLEPTAFILIGFVGGILVCEETYHVISGGVLYVPPVLKFAGILCIVALALLYSVDAGVRRMMDPLLRLATPLMQAFAGLVSLILYPITRLVRGFKKHARCGSGR